jgi:hypothetical protein
MIIIKTEAALAYLLDGSMTAKVELTKITKFSTLVYFNFQTSCLS